MNHVFYCLFVPIHPWKTHGKHATSGVFPRWTLLGPGNCHAKTKVADKVPHIVGLCLGRLECALRNRICRDNFFRKRFGCPQKTWHHFFFKFLIWIYYQQKKIHLEEHCCLSWHVPPSLSEGISHHPIKLNWTPSSALLEALYPTTRPSVHALILNSRPVFFRGLVTSCGYLKKASIGYIQIQDAICVDDLNYSNDIYIYT